MWGGVLGAPPHACFWGDRVWHSPHPASIVRSGNLARLELTMKLPALRLPIACHPYLGDAPPPLLILQNIENTVFIRTLSSKILFSKDLEPKILIRNGLLRESSLPRVMLDSPGSGLQFVSVTCANALLSAATSLANLAGALAHLSQPTSLSRLNRL
jgi:hypothetical protein